MVEDTIIIGAGPSGISAAIQLTRHGIFPLVLESGQAGGLLREANLVENYPGFPQGIVGNQLADRLAAHAAKAGIRIFQRRVMRIQRGGKFFRVRTNQEILFSRTLIVASGTKPRLLSGINFDRDSKDKVIYHIAPVINTKERHFVIVGSGDAAFDYALNLGRENTALIVNHGKDTKCLPLLRNRAESMESITHITNASIRAISKKRDGRQIIDLLHSGNSLRIEADYVVGAIGRDPQIDFFSHSFIGRIDELKEAGVLHLAGDVKNRRFRQAAIAAGDGILAGMMVFNTLRELKEAQ